MRILLVHWKEAEAAERAVSLRDTGHEVKVHWDAEKGAPELRRYRDDPPVAVVVSLDRLPAQGVFVAVWFRQQKSTRGVPLVFAGGKAEKVEAARRQLPDAVYVGWEGVVAAVAEAARRPVKEPVVPGTMDGYSGTPLSKKLGLKANGRVALLGGPEGFERKFEPAPEGLTVRKQARGEFAVVLLFVRSLAELRRRFAGAAKAVAQGGRLWIVWPKKASGIVSDVTQQGVREFGLGQQWVDFKIAAIDETWSGLAFARRKIAT